MSVTLTRRTVYKNGGASYAQPGVKASVYCGPKMFSGPAPETIEFGASNLAEPSTDTSKAEAKAKAAADREAAKAERAAKREEAKAAKVAERAQAKEQRETQRAEARKLREEQRAKIAEARKAGNIAPSAPAAETPAEQPSI